MEKVKVIFVCMGNICRSPTAEGVFRFMAEQQNMLDRLEIDSAGTHAYHVGEAPDPRAQQIASRRGVDLGYIQARKVLPEDIEKFDYVLAMDGDNLDNLLAIAPEGHGAKIRLFMDFADNPAQREVPDPYYGGLTGFDRVLDMIEAASAGLLSELKAK